MCTTFKKLIIITSLIVDRRQQISVAYYIIILNNSSRRSKNNLIDDSTGKWEYWYYNSLKIPITNKNKPPAPLSPLGTHHSPTTFIN